jgi:hypothetical protein
MVVISIKCYSAPPRIGALAKISVESYHVVSTAKIPQAPCSLRFRVLSAAEPFRIFYFSRRTTNVGTWASAPCLITAAKPAMLCFTNGLVLTETRRFTRWTRATNFPRRAGSVRISIRTKDTLRLTHHFILTETRRLTNSRRRRTAETCTLRITIITRRIRLSLTRHTSSHLTVNIIKRTPTILRTVTPLFFYAFAGAVAYAA